MNQIKEIEGIIGKTVSKAIFDHDPFDTQLFIGFSDDSYIVINSRSYEGSSEIEIEPDPITTLDEKLRYGLIQYKDYLIEKEKQREYFMKVEIENKRYLLKKLKEELGE
jgi:hypothetical protein